MYILKPYAYIVMNTIIIGNCASAQHVCQCHVVCIERYCKYYRPFSVSRYNVLVRPVCREQLQITGACEADERRWMLCRISSYGLHHRQGQGMRASPAWVCKLCCLLVLLLGRAWMLSSPSLGVEIDHTGISRISISTLFKFGALPCFQSHIKHVRNPNKMWIMGRFLLQLFAMISEWCVPYTQSGL